MSGEPNLGQHVPVLLQGAGWTVVIGAVLAFLQFLLKLAGGRQDARIAKLETAQEQHLADMKAAHAAHSAEIKSMHAQCSAEMEQLQKQHNTKTMALAHALIEVMGVLERPPTDDADLVRSRAAAIHIARLALVAVFTLPAIMPETTKGEP